jgi:hypothetical protein
MSWLRDIPGYEGKYAIDMGGNVYSYHSRKYLAPGLASSGYLTVSLGRHNSFGLHELILFTFVGPRPEGYVARHLNGDKLHNCVLNLEWSTYSQNAKDKKWHRQGYKLTPEQVAEIKDLLGKGATLEWIGDMYGVSKSGIHAISQGLYHNDV